MQDSPPASPGLPAFTYLSNHAHLLVALDANPEARVRDLASTVGITERAVQRIIADLEAVGVLVRQRTGRRNDYRIIRDSRLRHPLESHCTVGGLLEWIRRAAEETPTADPSSTKPQT